MNSRNGFTLIEVIAVLILLGIIGIFGSMFLTQIIKSYQFANDNSQLTQKAQVALTRISVELSYLDSATSNEIDETQDTITYSSSYPDGTSFSGNEIKKNSNYLVLVQNGTTFLLTDLVTTFDLKNVSSENFEIDLGLTGENGVEKIFKKTLLFD